MPLRAHDNQPSALSLLKFRHVEATTLIHDRQDFSAKIDHAFEELRGLRHARDLVRHWRHFVNGFDGQPELVTSKPKDQECALLTRAIDPSSRFCDTLP